MRDWAEQTGAGVRKVREYLTVVERATPNNLEYVIATQDKALPLSEFHA